MGVIPASTTTRARMMLMLSTRSYIATGAVVVMAVVTVEIAVAVSCPDSSTFNLSDEFCKYLVNIDSCLCTNVFVCLFLWSLARKGKKGKGKKKK